MGNVYRLLANHVIAFQSGHVFVAPTDVILSDHDMVEPDVVFVAEKNGSILKENNIQGPPDLVVEVLSPSTAQEDRGPKLDLYGRQGVREYWTVDIPARTIEVREFGNPRRTRVYQEGHSFESALLPGLVIRVDEIFRF